MWVDLGALTGAGRRAAVERVGLEELRIESSPRRAQLVVLRDKQEKPARRQQPAKGVVVKVQLTRWSSSSQA